MRDSAPGLPTIRALIRSRPALNVGSRSTRAVGVLLNGHISPRTGTGVPDAAQFFGSSLAAIESWVEATRNPERSTVNRF